MAAASHAAPEKRILAQLEHGLRPPAMTSRTINWRVDGWTIGLCALLLLMCGVAWLMHEKRITPETFRHGATSAPVRGGTTPARKTPAAESAPHAPHQAAAIVNEAAQPLFLLGAGDAAAEPPLSGAASASGSQPPPAKPATPTPTAVTAAIANTAAAPASPHKPVATGRTPAGRAAAAPAPPAQSPNDTDVTLLTALVAHAGTPSSVVPERSRDIVERQEGDTTSQLLARCKQLGLIEGMLCRSRICAGHWETDAACRAPVR